MSCHGSQTTLTQPFSPAQPAAVFLPKGKYEEMDLGRDVITKAIAATDAERVFEPW